MELLSSFLNNRFWKKNGVQLAWTVAVLCLALALSKVGWTVYSQAKIKQANYQPQQIKPIGQSAQQSYRVNDIVGANLFGDPTPKIAVENAPKTTLDLSLKGILWASDPQLARAIITAGKKKSKLYSVGEDIKGAGASVKEIRENEVLLNRNGATESLPMVKLGSGSDEPLVVFNNPDAEIDRYEAEIAASSAANRVRKSRLSGARSSTTNQQLNTQRANTQPRKLTKPKLSNLDKALQKMGEM